ncbi:hypothetical protein MGA5115_02960 [Marinomonas gallaica]|uniref:Uncharacterized protein n=1 Tax=Marinomonas gallaica TaxID=1806667 RepID=A0A1C3JUR5_9GAMM|nr:hypothetical protein MGA5115_02960 [Marinomonas gallaica]SBT21765.1 hypothetical protein MGA5116_02364 [Marinomonas gallaica]
MSYCHIRYLVSDMANRYGLDLIFSFVIKVKADAL